MVAAKTALLMDFVLEGKPDVGPMYWASQLMARTIPSSETGVRTTPLPGSTNSYLSHVIIQEPIPVWKLFNKLPSQVGELAPEFRKRFGWEPRHHRALGQTMASLPEPQTKKESNVWGLRTLKLTPEAKNILFPKGVMKLWALQAHNAGMDTFF